MVCDVVSLSDSEPENAGADKQASDEPLRDTQNDASVQQNVVIDSETQAVASENAQAHSANEDATVEMLPPPTTVTTVTSAPAAATTGHESSTSSSASGEPVVRKQCFRCEESFVKESSLSNHLKSDHGIMLFTKEDEKAPPPPATADEAVETVIENRNGPGKYVRIIHPKRKRHSTPSAETGNEAENRAKRKYAKVVSEPLRRSFSHRF